MLQGFIVLFAIITFTIMACDPRPNETSRHQSAWQTRAKTSDVLTRIESATSLENHTTKTEKIENEQT